MVRSTYPLNAILAAAIVLTFPVSARAQAVERAALVNGVELSLNIDDFAARTEIVSPVIRTSNGDANVTAFVASIIAPGKEPSVFVTGFLSYRGDWRRYDKALVRGGSELSAAFPKRDVVSCAGSRYRGDCTLSEDFQFQLPLDTATSIAENGMVQVQLRAGGGYPVMIPIRLNYVEAVDYAQAEMRAGRTPG